jgi:hypothetical protein
VGGAEVREWWAVCGLLMCGGGSRPSCHAGCEGNAGSIGHPVWCNGVRAGDMEWEGRSATWHNARLQSRVPNAY